MKANFKRLFALLLTLCLLASLMVPAAFAEEAAAEPEASATTVAETYPIRLVDMSQTDPTTATGYNTWFKGSSSGYKKNMQMSAVSAKIDSEYANGNLNWRFVAASDEYVYRYDAMHQVRLSNKGTYAALQIKVSEAGRYALKLTTDKTVDNDGSDAHQWTNVEEVTGWHGNVSAYIIPLAQVTDAAVIPELMTEEYSVGTKYLAKDATELVFDKAHMEEGEYVVVYTATVNSYAICEMSLLEDAADAAMYENEQVVTYPIRFADPTVDPATATGLAKVVVTGGNAYTNKKISAISSHITNAYNEGTINWKYLAESSANTAVYRQNTALQLRSDKDALIALQIKVPQSGFYTLTVGIDRVTDNDYVDQATNVTDVAFNVSAYLINANKVESVTAENIASLAVAENSVGVASLAKTDASAEFERTYLDAGEYVLIYSTNKQTAIGEFGLAQRKLDMNVTAEGAPAYTQHIELNARDIKDGTPLAGAGSYADISEYMNTAFAAGSVDWKIENFADEFSYANFSFIVDKGMKAVTPATSEGDWFAIRIRVAQEGSYSLSLKSAGDPAQMGVYMFPATSDAMTAEEIVANMTSKNGIHSQGYDETSLDAKISVGYLNGEYILAFRTVHASKSRTIYIDDIILEEEKFTAEDVQFYNFNLFDESNTAYYNLVNDRYTQTENGFEKIGAESGFFHSYDGVVLKKNADGTPKTIGDLYLAIYDGMGTGYRKTLNWRPDAAHAGSTDSLMGDMKCYQFFNNAATNYTAFMIDLSQKTSVGATQYGSIMLHVEKAGTYDLSIAAGRNDSLVKIHFMKAFTQNEDNGSYMNRVSNSSIQAILADGSCALTDDYITLVHQADNAIGQVTVDKAGDYLVVFEAKDEPINQDNDNDDKTTVDDIRLNSITMTPVIEEGVARIGTEKFASFEAAIAAAEAGETVVLLDNVVTGNVELGAGVTLNLNGYGLNAQNVGAIAPGAKIIDSGDGIAKLRATGNVSFNEDNGQLPLYNGEGNYYQLFNVNVEACATTGKQNATKYWFKISFSNEAAMELIGADTELRIMATMSGIYTEKHGEELAGKAFAAEATANAAFTGKWAANSDSYVVLSSAGSSGIDGFTLNPAVTANGVIISGDAMVRGI